MSWLSKLGKTVGSMATLGLPQLYESLGGTQGIASSLGGTSSVQTSQTASPRDASAQQMWDQYMSYFNGKDASGAPTTGTLQNLLGGQSDWLNQQFGAFSGAQQQATDEYGSVLDKLTSRMNDPRSQVSFGMQGGSPVSFTPRQTREDIGAIEGLASKALANSMTVPSSQFAWAQQNPQGASDLKYFDILSDLANRNEDRRFKLSTETSKDTSKAGLLDVLSSLGSLGQSGAQLISLLGGI